MNFFIMISFHLFSRRRVDITLLKLLSNTVLCYQTQFCVIKRSFVIKHSFVLSNTRLLPYWEVFNHSLNFAYIILGFLFLIIHVVRSVTPLNNTDSKLFSMIGIGVQHFSGARSISLFYSQKLQAYILRLEHVTHTVCCITTPMLYHYATAEAEK